MTRMTNDAFQRAWNSYLAAYADISAAERERLLTESVSDDIVFSNPTGEEGRGPGKLIEHVGQFQKKNPGAYFKSDEVLIHHGQLLSKWTMYKKDGSELATGQTYASFDESGRLTRATGFWKT